MAKDTPCTLSAIEEHKHENKGNEDNDVVNEKDAPERESPSTKIPIGYFIKITHASLIYCFNRNLAAKVQRFFEFASSFCHYFSSFQIYPPPYYNIY